MVSPIVLTKFGETLVVHQNNQDKDDNSELAGLFYHEICMGWIDIKPISDTHRVLRCRNCGLRIVLPGFVKTFGDLREYLKKKK